MIYVVDSNDRERMGDARDELTKMMSEDELKGAALLVLANKQDLPNAMQVFAIADALELTKLRNRSWFIQSACATTGDGIYEGLDWLTISLMKNNKVR